MKKGELVNVRVNDGKNVLGVITHVFPGGGVYEVEIVEYNGHTINKVYKEEELEKPEIVLYG